MKLFCALVVAPVLSFAALCDDAYSLKAMTQVMLTGPDPMHLDREVKSLGPDLFSLDELHPGMTYPLMTEFRPTAGSQGGCRKDTVLLTRYASPLHTDNLLWTLSFDSFYQMFDSTSHPNGLTFQYWFGFFRPQDSLKGFVGRSKGGDNYFSGWYAAMEIVDSLRNVESGLWSEHTTLIAFQGPTDSASLDKTIVEPYRKVAYDANHRAFFKAQFIKMSYGPDGTGTARPPATRLRAASPWRGFNLLGRFLPKGKP